VFTEFHPDAARLYDVTTSLRAVCTRLHDRTRSLDEIEIALFSPFRPMLADRAAIAHVPSVMLDRDFYVETKYDGERVQVHKQGDVYAYYSRK
jgi:DNA ligase-4